MNVNGESTSEINIKADCDLVLGKPEGLWQEKLTFCFKRNVLRIEAIPVHVFCMLEEE